MIVKVSFKVRKLGIWWIFGEIADYKLNKVLDGVKGAVKKVRIMLPPQTDSFTVLNRAKPSSGFSGRASNSSGGSGPLGEGRTSIFHSPIFQAGNLIKVQGP